jgi:carbonic anhydrase
MIKPRPTTPQEAWSELLAGNQRFVNEEPSHPHQDATRRQSLTHQQAPFATLFGCSDSRLAAEIIFDVGLGDMFVVRTAGHVLDESVLGSLEYGMTPLHIPLIVVLGHDNCGAVTATAEAYRTGQMPGGFIRDLVERITPSVMSAERQNIRAINDIVTEHVRQTMHRIPERSNIISRAIEQGLTAIVGVTYRLADGRAELVDVVGQLEPATL